MENLKIITDPGLLTDEEWGQFIKNHPDGNCFQSHEMHDFYNKSDNCKSIFVACLDKSGALQGILVAAIFANYRGFLKRFTRRSIVWGGPLVMGNKPAVFQELLIRYEKEIRRSVIYTEYRNLFTLEPYRSTLEQNSYKFNENYINILVNIDRDVVNRFSKSRRRQIKKAFNNGARIEEPGNMAEIQQFYSLLKELYRKKVRKPLPGWSFFKNFYLMSTDNNLGKFFLVKVDDVIIGGIMCTITPGKAIYEWYIAGKDSEYRNHYPSVLATYAPIEFARDNGLDVFDFMGAGEVNKDYGVREFKERFGGTVVNHGRFIKVHRLILMVIGTLSIRLKSLLRF